MPEPLPINSSRVHALAAKYGTPLQIYDENGILTQSANLNNAFREYFPGQYFQQYFAVKALPNPAILEILTRKTIPNSTNSSLTQDFLCPEFGLDCSSHTELVIAEKLGVTGERIMYTSNYTPVTDLVYACELGAIINFDDHSAVDQLDDYFKSTFSSSSSLETAKKTVYPKTVSFRVNPGVGRSDTSTKSTVLGGPDAKFGVCLDDVVLAYKKAKNAFCPLKYGMHMMTGSCVMDQEGEYWKQTVQILLDTVALVENEVGITIDFVNIGGGLGIPYYPAPKQSPLNLSKITRVVYDTFISHPTNKCRLNGNNDGTVSDSNSNGQISKPRTRLKLCMENGRYITGPAGWLLAKVVSVKDNKFGLYYGLNACMANLMRPGMYGAYHHITKVKNSDEEGKDGAKFVTANIVGSLCENNDWFAKDREVEKCGVGDLLVIHDTGAHGHSMGFQYNGKLRAPEVLLRVDGTESLIRRRETVDDYLATCIMPNSM